MHIAATVALFYLMTYQYQVVQNYRQQSCALLTFNFWYVKLLFGFKHVEMGVMHANQKFISIWTYCVATFTELVYVSIHMNSTCSIKIASADYLNMLTSNVN